jgi:uracil phosphoribosyltransferase
MMSGPFGVGLTLEDDRQALFILRHHRRFPPTSHALVEQVSKRILILTSTAREPMDDGLVFFHGREDSSFSAMTTSELSLDPVTVQTPLEQATGFQVSGKKLTLVPILRAGLGMVEGILRLVPSARVGHIGLYRDHDTLEPVDYYFKVPSDAAERDFFLLDPMLATGGSAVSAVSSLKRAGGVRIRFLCLVAAPEGVRRLGKAHPDVPVYAAALDRELNSQGYILPGLGDAGDRLFGTR